MSDDRHEGPFGRSACSALARSLDWQSTSLGPVASWSLGLRTTASMVFRSRQPMLLFWGPEHAALYNDAFTAYLGDGMHPLALGRRGRELWPALWPLIQASLEKVMREATSS